MRKCILGLICLILSTFTAAADDWDRAAAAYDTGRYQEAIDLTEPLAEDGLIDAQLALGQSYRLGKGAGVDEERSVYWYRLAADQHDPVALFNLGVLTLHGKGTRADPATAIDLLYAAATFEEPNSLFELCRIYLTGEYEPADIDLGLQFLA
ncbi:MAG: sel1 repeat family protein [Candidatus Devosia euplotis]|nr:sel1 repeat family protein [Candidatus Devosia euplotis]